MYPEELVTPMRADLISAGFKELKSAAQVDELLAKGGNTLIVINSVCGCSGGMARPAVKMAIRSSEKKPDNLATVFAGVDMEATMQARKHIPFPASSPSIALFKDGKVVHFIPRSQIESRSAEMIARDISDAIDSHC